MKKLCGLIFIGLIFPQLNTEYENVRQRRAELPKDILVDASDGSQNYMGRCGFIEVGDSPTILQDEVDAWVSAQHRDDTRDLSIPIAFHVIYASTNNGYVSSTAVNAQVDVLNDAFAPYGISFTLSSLDYTQNSSWFNNDNESQYKSQLAISPSTTLNIYTTSASGYLGYAYFPNSYSESSHMHGVVLNYDTLPGGAWPYNEGDTGVHEVGHYLGLYHTFEGGCYGSGDNVSDTPAQDDGNNIYECNNVDTCTNDTGNDPIHNYMNYTDDACLTEFTNGQGSRMDYMISTYKPNLGTEVNSDLDGDGVVDEADNCPNIANSNQSNYDGDGLGDACDSDIDNDGVSNNDDDDTYDEYACSDNDGDTCDDCSNGYYNPADDGWDYDGDGMCDLGDADDDNDGVLDSQDSDPNNQFVCMDSDGDTCDDCSSGTFSPGNDGSDEDGDGICDAGDIAEVTLSFVNASSTNISLHYSSDANIYGFQFVAEGAEIESVSCDIFDSNCGTFGCIGFSFSGEYFPLGEGILVTFTFTEVSNERTFSLSDILIGGIAGSLITVIGPDSATIPACDDNDGDGMCNAVDPEPNCATNDTDECDVCGGDGTSCMYQLGDVNMDNAVNVIDIVLIVDFILGNSEFTPEAFNIADASEDGNVNVIDIVILVEIILNP
ncbi:MAG: thrombospondin type 3 repeat-containing protein [Candidatus Marinimicrobia bacterium]|nr:thrombospondin type 3 repeat-containing protein [Candidatus Neomarinimicrobiota bacterium]